MPRTSRKARICSHGNVHRSRLRCTRRSKEGSNVRRSVSPHLNRRHDHDVAKTTEPPRCRSWNVRCCTACSALTSTTAGSDASSHALSWFRPPCVATSQRTDGSPWRFPRGVSLRRRLVYDCLCLTPSIVHWRVHAARETRGQLLPSVLQKICCSLLIGCRTIQMGWIHGTGNDEDGENGREGFLCGIDPHLRFRSRKIGTGRNDRTGPGGAEWSCPDRNTRRGSLSIALSVLCGCALPRLPRFGCVSVSFLHHPSRRECSFNALCSTRSNRPTPKAILDLDLPVAKVQATNTRHTHDSTSDEVASTRTKEVQRRRAARLKHRERSSVLRGRWT